MRRTSVFFLAWLALAAASLGAGPLPAQERGATADGWGPAVDGLACRILLDARYVAGQPIAPVFEIKNVSGRKRYIVKRPSPFRLNDALDLSGPPGKIFGPQILLGVKAPYSAPDMEPLDPGEVKRYQAADLREGEPERRLPGFDDIPGAAEYQPGKYVARFHFRSPKIEPRMYAGYTVRGGEKIEVYRDMPPDQVAGQWSGEAISAPVHFEVAPLAKEDLVIHEWGVFTVFNGVAYANAHAREEWGSLPPFFYRQFPKQRLRWIPGAWDKPIIYFYARPTSLRLQVRVDFGAGVPVVWWPAVASPIDDGARSRDIKPGPFRTLSWDAWLGERVPAVVGLAPRGYEPGIPWVNVTEFPLPADCWLRQARLPAATPLTVVGSSDGPYVIYTPHGKDRPETERFLYYDGLVPAPDNLRCEKIDDTTITLRNRAAFDVARAFVVDRRAKGTVGFAVLTGELKAGARVEVVPKRVRDWPAAGERQVRQVLLDAGLFAPEADALLALWRSRLFEADGVTLISLLPAAEYDRMLPLSITPAPAAGPVRVGVVLQPHVDLEPDLTARVAALIRDLDGDFRARSAATTKLLEIGPIAVTHLRAELQKPLSLEARRRIESVLDRVDAMAWIDGAALKGKQK